MQEVDSKSFVTMFALEWKLQNRNQLKILFVTPVKCLNCSFVVSQSVQAYKANENSFYCPSCGKFWGGKKNDGNFHVA